MAKKNRLRFFISLLFLVLLTGCVSQAERGNDAKRDPLQSYNRVMFRFNQDFNKTFVEPVNWVYVSVTPRYFRTGVGNFFNNIAAVPDVVNDVLQINFKYAANDTIRFILNSTLGIFGLFDIATNVGIPAHEQGFGLTLGRWGLGGSPYIVLPIIGPSTMAETFGLIPNFLLSPLTYTSPACLRNRLWALYLVQTASDAIPEEKLITANAIDPYIALRSAYLQRQNHLLHLVENQRYPNDLKKHDRPKH